MRYRHLVKPFGSISLKNCFMAGSVGSMAVSVLPFRLGDFVRPLVVHETEGLPVMTAFGAAILERIIDGLLTGIMLFAAVIAYREVLHLPPRLVAFCFVPMLLFGSGIVLMSFGARYPARAEALLRRLFGIFSKRAGIYFAELAGAFLKGMKALTNLKILSIFGGESLLYWLINALTNLFLIYAFGFAIEEAFVVSLIMIGLQVVGMTIPGLPAGVGPFDFFTIYTLTIVGIGKSEAVAYTAVCHGTIIAVTVLSGLFFMFTGKISFKRLSGEIATLQKRKKDL
jgi:uncharacterized protein (TIRG00374 family)